MTQEVHVTIRRANSDEASLLAELGARTFHETFAADNTEEDMTSYLALHFSVEQQTAELALPASTFLIAEVDGQAAGYAMHGRQHGRAIPATHKAGPARSAWRLQSPVASQPHEALRSLRLSRRLGQHG